MVYTVSEHNIKVEKRTPFILQLFFDLQSKHVQKTITADS